MAEVTIDGIKATEIGYDDLKKEGLSDKSLNYFKGYGYKIYKPVSEGKYIYVYEPDDTERRFAMEFLSFDGMNKAFEEWDDLAKEA
ncbi:MAG: hypothetical protein VZR00_08590 [Lachnospiraceae bacterium]|nr:hypothetical protein [Lachnospiraceae bacterium]MEE3461924.1 hypothetical protein [Lachnospiraceae bacterium]